MLLSLVVRCLLCTLAGIKFGLLCEWFYSGALEVGALQIKHAFAQAQTHALLYEHEHSFKHLHVHHFESVHVHGYVQKSVPNVSYCLWPGVTGGKKGEAATPCEVAV